MQKINNYCWTFIKFLIAWATCVVIIFCCWTHKKTDLLAIPYPPALINFNTSSQYLSSNLASPCQLGNHIFELASLYGLSKHLNRTPAFFIESGYHKNMLDSIRSTMPGLIGKYAIFDGSVPTSLKETKFQKVCCVYENPWNLKRSQHEYLHLTGKFYQSWKYFPNMREELISFLNTSVQNFGILPISNNNTHVSCVHSRRGDFVEMNFYATDPKFMKNAVKFLKEKENYSKKNQKIVLFGDDFKFMRNLFSEAKVSTDAHESVEYYISQNSAIDDFLYSAYNCDEVLITAPRSTFGWWLGYFSKGDKVYYLDIKHARDRVTMER
ncbi:L-Fucosyltransferase [Caenorhabditis elegans]|uniref:L-Fucosyltransferase n=1 Tax=Caenorhabditis elegans TaxID=6239 RepID=A0A0K3AXR8_CAEEL|nr:L-Fucosyltransferase [Caenorhabditis elegans]CTQ86788.1 L-Fucosyltransferase [Caenorhabditis elegans]|eukprot:NP_001300089.1 Uncharacterized protein CELE_F31F4.11 [Caenorhabditis elegans]